MSTSTWNKQRGFNQLESAVISLRNTHQIADLMELVSQEVPIDVDLAAQDSTKQTERVLASAYNVDNINGPTFLTAQSKVVHLRSETLSDRPEGILYFRFLISLKPASVDHKIRQKPTFCLLSTFTSVSLLRFGE